MRKRSTLTRSGWILAALVASGVHPSPAAAQQALPDLTIDAARLQASAGVKTGSFKPTDCAVVEGCVDRAGKRKLLRFDVATPNIGSADLVLGDPSLSPLFVFSACHRHFHFSGYALYELLDASGATVLTGRKQAFCLEDFLPWDPGAGAAQFTCGNQGISVGWQDIYASHLDCQWLDVTGVPRGQYQLRVTINPDLLLTESDYGNNVATVPVKIPR